MFHIASQCVAPFMVSFAIKQKTDFVLKIDQQIQRLLENGFVAKMRRDIEWDVLRSSKGKLFTVRTRKKHSHMRVIVECCEKIFNTFENPLKIRLLLRFLLEPYLTTERQKKKKLQLQVQKRT